MARTRKEIKNEMIISWINQEEVRKKYGIVEPGNDNHLELAEPYFTAISIENLIFTIVATSIWILEIIMDQFKKEVNSIVANKGTHNLQWYVNKAKAFQFGEPLVDNTDYYATEKKDKQIIKHAAVEEKNGKLIMKVAKMSEKQLAPLSSPNKDNPTNPDELGAFIQYINCIKDAGVNITVISDKGDDLNIVLDIYYDPLVLNASGGLLDKPDIKPVEIAIKEFITNLPFNGEFIPTALVDTLQGTEGVDIPEIRSVATKFAKYEWKAVSGKEVPNSGYLSLTEGNLKTNYKPNVRD